MQNFKIGEEVKFKEDFEVETFGGRNLKITTKDKAIACINDKIRVLSGEAKHVYVKLDSAKTKGYDYANLANLVYKGLNGYFRIDTSMSDMDIDVSDFKDCVKHTLQIELNKDSKIDTELISKKILLGLKNEFEFEEVLEIEDLNEEEFTDVIYDILSDIF